MTTKKICIGAIAYVVLYLIFLFVSIKKVKENRDYYKPNNDW